MSIQRREALESLHRGIKRCRKCFLCQGRKHAVPGEGPHDAEIVFIGEAPGEIEDQQGKPFRGRSGSFFDELLTAAGIDREEVYITSSVKCRPPGNRDPKPAELKICRRAWLVRQLEIIAPRLIVLLGKVALLQILGETGPLRNFHGKIIHRDGRLILPTYHPAAGMRFPSIRGTMRRDFSNIGRIISVKRLEETNAG